MTARAGVRLARDTRLRRALVTPEGVPLTLDVASAGTRVTAFALDLAIIVGALIGMTLLLILLFWTIGISARKGEIVGVLWLTGLFLGRNAYFLYFELGPRAATPGKRRAGIRVGARDGGRLTADAIIARNLLREVEVVLPLSFLGKALAEGGGTALSFAGLAWTATLLLFPLFNRDRLRPGDLIAGTWVIRDPRRPLGRALAAPAAHATFSFSDAEVGAYGIHELHTLEEVLRTGDGTAQSRVAQAITAKIGWTVRAIDERDFLDAYYAALRVRLERELLLGRRRRDKHDAAA